MAVRSKYTQAAQEGSMSGVMYGPWIGEDLQCRAYEHQAGGFMVFAVQHGTHLKMVRGDTREPRAYEGTMELNNATVTRAWDGNQAPCWEGCYLLKNVSGDTRATAALRPSSSWDVTLPHSNPNPDPIP